MNQYMLVKFESSDRRNAGSYQLIVAHRECSGAASRVVEQCRINQGLLNRITLEK